VLLHGGEALAPLLAVSILLGGPTEMTSAIIAAAAALGGVIVGFFLRWGEFRRDKRYEIYTDYLTALVHLGRAADASSSDPRPKSIRDALDELVEQRINLQLVVTRRIRDNVAEADHFVEHEIAAAEREPRPPDPSHPLEQRAVAIARAFAKKGKRDVAGFGLPIP
jgi:hypothetical protein